MVSRDADKPASAESVLVDRLLSYALRQAPGEQQKRGDKRLDEARDLIVDNQLSLSSDDLQITQDEIIS